MIRYERKPIKSGTERPFKDSSEKAKRAEENIQKEIKDYNEAQERDYLAKRNFIFR